MPIVNSKKVQLVKRPLDVPAPDRIVDPFTIQPLDDLYLNPKTQAAFRQWYEGIPDREEIDELELFDEIDSQRYEHLMRNIGQGHFRVGAPVRLLTPDGKTSERTKRPDDFSLESDTKSISPMNPTEPYENSHFWNTRITKTCYPPVAAFKTDGSNTPAISTATALAIENTFPFLNAQELIVFPNTKAVSISQLNNVELEALGALLQDRYRAMQDAGHKYVWFGMHRGKDGGGTLEHLHFQVYGSDIPPRVHSNIWANEDQLGLSHFEFQRLRGELTISKDPHRNTETFSPYTGGFPLGMGVAFTRETTANIANLEPKEYLHFDDMSSQDLQNWLAALASAVETIEGIPLKSRANGLAGYSLSFVVPPKGSNLSPMTWNVNPAKLRSVPFEQFDGLENPINPFNARDILSDTFTRTSLQR
ncbi:MAG TPA: hypothetical protein PLT55_00490 [Acidimicrobiia bacterium]|nr:hypothetical protein [Acidimicrobiia bacterium]